MHALQTLPHWIYASEKSPNNTIGKNFGVLLSEPKPHQSSELVLFFLLDDSTSLNDSS